ncbi:MAG: putative branched-chain-amino-acid aminotransferase [Phycisphaerales bacterium]|nr:putative branched-chain-amino-acid aminotransferase [Phycisphaerales bacterium]
MPDVWLNGQFTDEIEASVSIRDTGFLHAAGVFTTLRGAGRKLVRIEAHLKRLRESCDALFVPLLPKDEILTEAATEVLKRNALVDARMRITVTRGTTHQDPIHGLHAEPTVLISATPFEPYPAEFYTAGMTVLALDRHKLNPYDPQAGHKTLDYFSRLTALREAARRGAAEALWFNVHNYLQCGCISNVFLVNDGVLMTPPTNEELRDPNVEERTPYPKSNVLPGITRAAVLDAAKAAGINVLLRGLSINDVLGADEVLLTNSIMGVMPVGRVEQHSYDGAPGAITHQLIEAVR